MSSDVKSVIGKEGRAREYYERGRIKFSIEG